MITEIFWDSGGGSLRSGSFIYGRFTAGMDRIKTAFLHAEAAVITFIEVDHSKIIFHGNGLTGAGLEASFAAGTSYLSLIHI